MSGGECKFTSHVFLSLEYHESVSAMGLLLLVGLLVGMRVCYDSNLEDVSLRLGSRWSCGLRVHVRWDQSDQTPSPGPSHQRHS